MSIGKLETEADLERFVDTLLQHRLTLQSSRQAAASSDLTTLQAALTANRTVCGQVSSTGTVTRGRDSAGLTPGFSAVRNAGGDYTVTFTTAFAAIPVVVVGMGPASINAQVQLHVSTPPSVSGFRVVTTDAAGAGVSDQPWTFIAMAV